MPDETQLAEIRFTSHAEQLHQVRKQVRTAIENVGASCDCVDHIVIAVNEACMNVIQHAYGEECDNEIVLKIFSDHDQLVFRLFLVLPPKVSHCYISPATPTPMNGGWTNLSV